MRQRLAEANADTKGAIRGRNAPDDRSEGLQAAGATAIEDELELAADGQFLLEQDASATLGKVEDGLSDARPEAQGIAGSANTSGAAHRLAAGAAAVTLGGILVRFCHHVSPRNRTIMHVARKGKWAGG